MTADAPMRAPDASSEVAPALLTTETIAGTTTALEYTGEPIPGPQRSGAPEGEDSLAPLWRAFMSARILLALAIVGLHASAATLAQALSGWALAGALAYLALTLAQRIMLRPPGWGQTFDSQWIYTIGIDLLYFSVLRVQSVGAVDYTPLLALPVMMAAILGSRALAVGTAALAALIQFGSAIVEAQGALWLHAAQIGQAALVGTGLLALAWFANTLSARLMREQRQARSSRADARIQELVNNLVLETLGDGVLVVDSGNLVRTANPSARALLGSDRQVSPYIFSLTDDPAWAPLVQIAQRTFSSGPVETLAVTLGHEGEHALQVHVRTERTPSIGATDAGLCVMFLQDQREIEAHVRTEKLASMGRMSAAVAHEFRNPLAAINQANDLLDEELTHAEARRLTGIIGQNVQRLAHIVEDVLDVARAGEPVRATGLIPLDRQVHADCVEWAAQQPDGARLQVERGAEAAWVRFSPEHLRRIVVNLLDNAGRYASREPGAIQVTTAAGRTAATLSVWSDSAPIDTAFQRHLFEPFFSSESRSSGLGLFICRQLCEQHGAAIWHQRATRGHNGRIVEGNEFLIRFERADDTHPAEYLDEEAIR